MHILLIEQLRTSTTTYRSFEKFLLTSFSILPTLYVRRLAAITPKHHKITLINERYQPILFSNIYDLVVINFNIGSAFKAYEVADRFRSLNLPVVLCGLHASALPDEGLKHADTILLGRGETNWLSLLDDFEKNGLKSIYPPEPYHTISHPIPPVNVELQGFQLMGAIEVTRGCPYKCNFCPESNTPDGSSFYKRPINEIIEELKTIPQRIVMFYDSSLTIDPEYTKKLFKEMKPLNKKFFCNGNVDVISQDDELVKLSKKAGCIGWLIGFESISQDTIDHVKKKTNTVSVYKKAIDLIHSNKMMVVGDFMFGFDTDTKDVFTTTVQTIQAMGIDVADFTIATPFPGTQFFTNLEKQQRIITKDWTKYSMYTVVYEPKNMSKEELTDGIILVYQQFYSFKNTMRRIIKGTRLGWYPFFAIIIRNIIAMIASFKIKNLNEI